MVPRTKILEQHIERPKGSSSSADGKARDDPEFEKTIAQLSAMVPQNQGIQNLKRLQQPFSLLFTGLGV